MPDTGIGPFTKFDGHAPLTKEYLNAVAEGLEGLTRMSVAAPLQLTWVGGIPCLTLSQPFRSSHVVKLTDHSDVGEHGDYDFPLKYSYVEQELYLDTGASALACRDKSGGIAGSFDGDDPAFNLYEVDCDSVVIYGVDTSGVDYPDGFDPVPPDGIVELIEDIDSDGNRIRYFAKLGTHDGTCDAGEA